MTKEVATAVGGHPRGNPPVDGRVDDVEANW